MPWLSGLSMVLALLGVPLMITLESQIRRRAVQEAIRVTTEAEEAA
jgi:hypothetical protein